MIDDARVHVRCDAPLDAGGDYVLYWMIAARRTVSNPALEQAIGHARALGKPLLVLEALRLDYPWACDRFHRFVVEGMADNAAAFEAAGVRYHAFVEREAGQGRGLLEALATRACVVVTDLFPAFFLDRMVEAAASRLSVRLEAIDGNGVLPLREAPRIFTTAASFRRHLQKHVAPWLERLPLEDPLAELDLPRLGALPDGITARWPHAGALLDHPERVADLGLGGPGFVAETGGAVSGGQVRRRFLEHRLARYLERNHPDRDVASGLSPWLHFGHVGAADLVRRVLEREDWDPGQLGPVTGSRAGWWGLSDAAESFLDEIVTWRELGQGFAWHEPRHDRFDTLPAWARTTLADHADDPRPELYDVAALAAAETSDPLWNAAQRQLVAEGTIQNYLRMLWGKRVLAWSATPEQAWERLIELNNRFALDGRDANSYSGIGWVFGRFDRAWGPERPIYGKVRYMTSDSTRKKLKLKHYLEQWGYPR